MTKVKEKLCWIVLLGLLPLATSWLTCSERPVCSEQRTKIPTANETYNVVSSKFDDNLMVFDLTNGLGGKLVLTVSKVGSDIFRVVIEEPDSHRYHITHSLDKEPITEPLLYLEDDATLLAWDLGNNTIRISYQPLKIEFFHDDVLQAVFHGKRMFMNNSDGNQAFSFSVEFPGVKSLLGLHEHAATVSLLHTADLSKDPYRFKNIDHGSYEMNSTLALYSTVPLIYGFGPQKSSGIFLNNAAEMWVDIENTDTHSSYFMVNSGVLDLFVFNGPTLPDAVRQYTEITGRPHMPQLWTLGYHQSRWGYKSAENVKSIIENYDEYGIPLDAVWLDLDYTVGRRYFTWDSTGFPDPLAMLGWVRDHSDRKMVIVSDPHIKVDDTYEVYSTCLEKNYFVNNSENTEAYLGTCWPGNSNWIDFLNPEARDYYASLHSYENFPSTSTLGGFWNDMNEPATFDDGDDERTLPYGTFHYGEIKHGDLHNMYGLLQVMATHQGLMERDSGTLRPFVLTRSAFAGSQRYAIKWAGDTGGSYDYLRVIVPMAINSNLAGMVFYGGDVPGFLGDPTAELATRWYQTGAWITFFRAHGHEETKPREPWIFPDETRELIKDSVVMRYLHLPYWYTQFYEHVRTGSPIIRGLFYQYPNDDNIVDINDEFLVGSDILVANVYFPNATNLRVYLPGINERPGINESWFQITGDSNRVYQGGEWYTIPVNISFIPVFYRSGSIIARKVSSAPSSILLKDVGYEFHIIVDQDGNSRSRFYVDDFESFDYLNEKEYLYMDISYNHSNGSIELTLVDQDCNFSDFIFTIENAVIYTDNGDGTYVKTQYAEGHDGNLLSQYNVFETSSLKLH